MNKVPEMKSIEASRIERDYPRPSTRGYLYCIFSPTFPKHVKLGMTIEPSKRYCEYNNYNPNCDWKYKYISKGIFEDCKEAEKMLIRRLSLNEKYPIYNKEFYDSSITELIIDIIKNLENEE